MPLLHFPADCLLAMLGIECSTCAGIPGWFAWWLSMLFPWLDADVKSDTNHRNLSLGRNDIESHGTNSIMFSYNIYLYIHQNIYIYIRYIIYYIHHHTLEIHQIQQIQPIIYIYIYIRTYVHTYIHTSEK